MAATSTTSDTTPATAEGPVLTVLTKRIRSLRKKLNRILQMEQSLSNGKTLNSEQQEVLRSKPSLLVLIDELEKLRQPLSAAIQDEISLAAPAPATATATAAAEEHHHHHPPPLPPPDSVKDLLNLIYFGSLFDVKPQSDFTSIMLTRTHERGCCLTYDYVTDDAVDLLGERDLDLISALQGLMISRPVDSTLSHQDALERCVEHAKRWIANSDEPVAPESGITYAGLRERLNKIMASDYFTATPQMTGPGEVVAAAAVGHFGSFQVPMQQETMVSVEVPVQVEGSAVGQGQYQQVEENSANQEQYVTVENQSGTIENYQKEDLEHENSPEVVSAQAEQEQWHAEGEREDEGHGHTDLREQQYGHRRGQRGGGGRGGRRGNVRGRGSSRGGGPYQNGRTNQYYDNYYASNPNPRNVYYNRRGNGRGAGGGGGGNSYYNHPSAAAQGNHTQADVGVAS